MVTYGRHLSKTSRYLLVYHILESKHSNHIFRDLFNRLELLQTAIVRERLHRGLLGFTE